MIIHKLIRLLLYIGIPTSDMGQVDHSKTGRLTIGFEYNNNNLIN